MNIEDLETYEQLQLEVTIRGMTILEFIKKYKNNEVDNKYFIYGKRIFAFNLNGNFLDCDYELHKRFSCYDCNSLTSLVGAPKIVEGSFSCYGCNNLTNLKGAPEVVKGKFYCGSCNLISLEGAPKIVEGDFYCFDCNNLPNNIEKPEGVKGKFFIDIISY